MFVKHTGRVWELRERVRCSAQCHGKNYEVGGASFPHRPCLTFILLVAVDAIEFCQLQNALNSHCDFSPHNQEFDNAWLRRVYGLVHL